MVTLIIKVSLKEQPLREPVDELNFNTVFMNTGEDTVDSVSSTFI